MPQADDKPALVPSLQHEQLYFHNHEQMFEMEEKHWWYKGTRRVIFSFMDRALAGVEKPSVLDVGCGTGATMMQLAKRYGGPVSGLEYSPTAARLCTQRGINRLVCASADELPFASESFDGVLALDVLEHLEDDLAMAREIRRILKPGGVFVATAPAFGFLWSEHDLAVAHKRRYWRRELDGVLQKGGFAVERISYYSTGIFPVVASIRLGRRLIHRGPMQPKTDFAKNPPLVSGFLAGLYSVEAFLLKYMRLPFGVSLIALARRA